MFNKSVGKVPKGRTINFLAKGGGVEKAQVAGSSETMAVHDLVENADAQWKGEAMYAETEAVYSPEIIDVENADDSGPVRLKVIHLRYRVGDYDVTRLVLDSQAEPETKK